MPRSFSIVSIKVNVTIIVLLLRKTISLLYPDPAFTIYSTTLFTPFLNVPLGGISHNLFDLLLTDLLKDIEAPS